MADPDRDARVSEHYRALGREEPPPALDSAILAASRRRPLRWAVPVSVAAVIVLAVGVTLRVQLEEPQRPEEVALAPKVLDAPALAPADELARQSRRDAAPARAPAAAPPATVAQESRAQEPKAGAGKREALAEATADRAEPAGRASAGVAVGKIARAPETPEQWLERIAKLRDAGRAREADESLAEFRKRYPDYRIPEKMRARVAPR
jgi:hypothetical protein